MRKKRKEKMYKFKLPRLKILIWLKGKKDGKNGNATLNEKQVVESAEIEMYQKRFQVFAGRYIQKLDQELHELSADAEKIIYDLNKKLPQIPESIVLSKEAGAIEQRAAKRRQEEINQIKTMRMQKVETDIKHLIEIRTQFSKRETECQECLITTAAAIEEVFAVYCKGVLQRKTVVKENIPVIRIEGEIIAFHHKIAWIHGVLEKIDKEVAKYEQI